MLSSVHVFAACNVINTERHANLLLSAVISNPLAYVPRVRYAEEVSDCDVFVINDNRRFYEWSVGSVQTLVHSENGNASSAKARVEVVKSRYYRSVSHGLLRGKYPRYNELFVEIEQLKASETRNLYSNCVISASYGNTSTPAYYDIGRADRRLHIHFNDAEDLKCDAKDNYPMLKDRLPNSAIMLISGNYVSLSCLLQRFSEVPDQSGMAILSVTPGNPLLWTFLMQNLN